MGDDESTGSGDASTSTSSTTETCPIGMNGCPCTGGGACDPGLECSADQVCEPVQSSSGTTQIVDPSETGDSSGGESTIADESTTTGGAECNTPGSPEESMECTKVDVTRPFCGPEGTCTGCVVDEACDVGTNGVRPICQMSGAMAGACVECNVVDAVDSSQCEADKPHCNLDTFECEGCLEHSECPSTACDVAARTCFSDSRVIYVRRGPTMQSPCTYDVPSGGGPGNPYCDMDAAIQHAQYNGVTSGWTFVLMASDSSDNHGAFTIMAGEIPVSYAIVHTMGSVIEKHVNFIALGPVVTVHDKVTLYMVDFGVNVAGNAFADTHFGIECLPGGSVWLDGSRVLNSRGPGIRADQCDIHLRRSSVAFGRTEGIDMKGGSLHLQNSFIDENGSDPAFGGGGIRLSAGAAADIVYSTLANNKNVPQAGGDTVDCDGSVTLKIRNSIFAHGKNTGNASVVCDEGEVMVLDSVVDGDFGADNGNHKLASEDILGALSVDSITGAYRIINPNFAELFENKALWRTGDPHDDYDRQPRNASEGSPDYAGADVYAP